MTTKLSPEIQQKIMEFQETQQQAQIVFSQKYQMEIQLNEVKNAIAELEKLEKAEVHKAVGQILIKACREDVLKELKEKNEILSLRLGALQKQEAKLREKLKSLQDRLSGVVA